VTSMADPRREDLAQFLRSRRARIAPADVGLPEGRRRRTPGLRREEVAQLAGVGVTWYTWLEQGRAINASVQVLDAIARTLRLDRAEREHLYLLAGLPSVPDPAETCLPAEVQSVMDALSPVPAVVYSGRYDALAWNGSYATIFPRLTGAPVAERNVLWQMFTTPACCSAIGNRAVEVATMVATFRAAYARRMGEPTWVSFVDRLSAVSEEFAAMWARHDVASPALRVKIFVQNLGRPDIRTTTTSFAVAGTPDARMVVYLPVSEADRVSLEQLLLEPPTITRCTFHQHELAATA